MMLQKPNYLMVDKIKAVYNYSAHQARLSAFPGCSLTI